MIDLTQKFFTYKSNPVRFNDALCFISRTYSMGREARATLQLTLFVDQVLSTLSLLVIEKSLLITGFVSCDQKRKSSFYHIPPQITVITRLQTSLQHAILQRRQSTRIITRWYIVDELFGGTFLYPRKIFSKKHQTNNFYFAAVFIHF